MKYLLPLLPLFLLLTACADAPDTTTRPAYFDVAGYVRGQVAALTQARPTVKKRAQLGANLEQQTTRAINWSRELELFAQADINKPALRNSYTTTRPDSLTYLYRLKPGEKNLPVQLLTVRLDSATGKPRQIEATLTTKNPLYTAEKYILLESGLQKNNAWAVTHYRLRGFQHLRVSNKNTFDVEGHLYP